MRYDDVMDDGWSRCLMGDKSYQEDVTRLSCSSMSNRGFAINGLGWTWLRTGPRPPIKTNL